MTAAALPLLIWLLGFIQTTHVSPWTAFHAEAPSFVAVVVGLFFLARKAAVSIEPPKILGLWAVLAASVLIQQWAGLSLYAGDGYVVMAYLLLFLLAFWWGALWAEGLAGREAKSEDVLIPLSGFLLAAGLLTAFQILAQWLDVGDALGGWVYDHIAGQRAYGNIGQPNQAGTVLVMAAVAVHYLHAWRRVSLGLALVLLLLLGWSQILTQSRTALLSTTVLTALLVWRPLQSAASDASTASGTRARALAVVWLACVGLMALLFRMLPGVEGARADHVVVMATVGLRPVMWRESLLGVLDKPWTGWGWLQVPLAQQAGARVIAGTEATDWSHNIVLDMLVMLGVPLTLLIAAWVLRAFWRRRKRIAESDGAWAALCLGMPVLVHAQLEYPHTYAYLLLSIGLLLGAAERWTRPGPQRGRMVFSSRWARLLPALPVAVGAYYAVLAFDYLKVEEDYGVQRLTAQHVGQTPSDYQPPDIWLLDQYDELLRTINQPIRAGMSAEALDRTERVARRHTMPSVRYNAALALALNGREAQAREILLVLKNLYPSQIYREAQANWRWLGEHGFPQLKRVELP